MSMKRNATILLICALISFLSCQRVKTGRFLVTSCEDCPAVNIELDNLKDEIKLSGIIDSIKYVFLNTDDNDLPVGEIHKIRFFEDKIFVSDYSNSVFCFDLEGKLIYHINEVGRGKGEYIGLKDFTIDFDHRSLIISDDIHLVSYDLEPVYNLSSVM